MGWSVNRPTGLTFHRAGMSTKGYTLLTPHGDASAYLIDMDGCVVHRWKFRTHPSRLRPAVGERQPAHDGIRRELAGSAARRADQGTAAARVARDAARWLPHDALEVDWDGNVVWEYENRFQHHDFHRFANGNTMVPEWVEVPEELHKKVRGGYKMPRERLPRLLGDDLVEIDPDQNEVRRIHVWELLDPVKDPIQPTIRRWEWTHVNGLDVNDAGDIVFSARSNDRVAVDLRRDRRDRVQVHRDPQAAQSDLGRGREHPGVRQRSRHRRGSSRSTRRRVKSSGSTAGSRATSSSVVTSPARPASSPATCWCAKEPVGACSK